MLTQSTGYAITALGLIAASNGKPLVISQIAKIAEIPEAYLGKIMTTLSKKGIIRSQRGIGGGITLSKAAEDITAYEICQIFDDPAISQRCAISNQDCSDRRACPLHNFWHEHRDKNIDFLKKTTVSHFAAFETKFLKNEQTKKTKSLSRRKK